MKKFIFAAAILLGLAAVIKAAPESSNGTVKPVEYGGLNYSTRAFSVEGATVAGWGVINKVNFTTGITGDYVDFWVATAAVSPAAHFVHRVFNVANTTASVHPLGNGYAAGLSDAGNILLGPYWHWKANSALYEMITVIYGKP